MDNKDKDSILIEILTIGEKYLREEKKGITLDILRTELKDEGFGNELIESALSLFYPENFKNKYNEDAWLSSDGHIRLLQYRSLEKSEENLKLAKQSLTKSENNLELAENNLRLAERNNKNTRWTLRATIFALIITVCCTIFSPNIQQRWTNSNEYKKQEKNDSIKIELLQQIIKHQDSINHSLKKLDESILKNQSHDNDSLKERE
jgi:hypothetical protein